MFLVFTEEIAFKHFLFINVTKSKVFFSVITQTSKNENLKYFKDYDVYLINVFKRVIL